jgi:hypothetical protein
MHDPLEGEPETVRARMEHTLTDGYARALALEGERLQLEKELASAARTRSSPSSASCSPRCATAPARFERPSLREPTPKARRADG